MNKEIKNAVGSKMAETDFSRVLEIIQQRKTRAFQAVNIALIDTYWQVGHYLSIKAAEVGWGKGVVKELAAWLSHNSPDLKGFSAQNLWRMKQFYEIYHNDEKLSALLRVLSWTHHCILLAQCKTDQERHFYAHLCVKSGWSTRELENA